MAGDRVPEFVVTLPLPDRATVAAATTSIWTAPLESAPVPELSHHDAPRRGAPHVETGTVVAAPRVLHRNDHAAVVLTRVTAVDTVLSLETLGVADAETPPRLAVIRQGHAFWLSRGEGTTTGGPDGYAHTQEHTVEGDTLDLLVTWPAAELLDTRVRVPIQQGFSG